jgi:actin-related protein
MPGGTLAAATWCGGAVLSRVVFSSGQAVTRGEYDESGPSVVHRKCTP